MKVFTSKTQKTGKLGENIATRYLVARGFSIIERNHTRKWGEIDIIARKDGSAGDIGHVIHFIEVKTVSRESLRAEIYRPEDNMHHIKALRLKRTISTCLLEYPDNTDWQFDLVCVYLDDVKKRAQVRFMEDIIL